MKTKKDNTKRRCIRRGHVSTQTALQVSCDTWLLVCMHLEHSPHAVFRLMMTSKGTLSAFEGAPEAWWVELFNKIKRYQGSLKHSNFLKRLEHLQVQQKLPCCEILRGIFTPRCNFCGTRFGHRMLQPFAIRTCAECMRANIISNSVLESRYGLSFSDFLEEYAMEGGFLVPLDSFRFRVKALHCLSDDKLDTRYCISKNASRRGAARVEVRFNTLYFLWRPDIERILGLRLEARLSLVEERKQAVSVLSAYFRRASEAALTSQALCLFKRSDSFRSGCAPASAAAAAAAIDIKAWRGLAHSMRIYNNSTVGMVAKGSQQQHCKHHLHTTNTQIQWSVFFCFVFFFVFFVLISILILICMCSGCLVDPIWHTSMSCVQASTRLVQNRSTL